MNDDDSLDTGAELNMLVIILGLSAVLWLVGGIAAIMWLLQ